MAQASSYDLLHAAFGDALVSWADAAHREEPRGKFQSPQIPLLRPRNTEEVAAMVKLCHDHGIGIVPYAGGTGLVGGQVTDGADHVILSVERMNTIRAVHPLENVLVAEAGVILEDIQTAAAEHDRLFPLSLAAEGSCRIGGNLATNAGGQNVLRYGNARDLCLGVEAVLPDGTIHHGLRRLRKDNTGYDLRNLLIGSEGTLGIITAAALKLFPQPKETMTAFLVVPSVPAALELLAHLQGHLDGTISAFELIHRTGLDFLAETMPDLRQPFAETPEWSVLLELGAGVDAGLEVRLFTALETPMESGLVTDALIAQSQAQSDGFWELRESIPLANRQIGAIASHDVSLPLTEIAGFVTDMPADLAKIADIRINCFGHLGDGNLHYNLFPTPGRSKVEYANQSADLSAAIHDAVMARGGSFSAEHGVGRLKAADLERYADPAKLSAMRAIKSALDPKGIMNPGAVLTNK